MSQSRIMSLVESGANIVVGVGVALASQLVVFPMVGIHVPLSTNLEIVGWFTLISLVRNYAVRRLFDSLRSST